MADGALLEPAALLALQKGFSTPSSFGIGGQRGGLVRFVTGLLHVLFPQLHFTWSICSLQCCSVLGRMSCDVSWAVGRAEG